MARALLTIPLLCMVAAQAHAQQRDPPGHTGAAVLRGRVVAGDAGRPVSRAQVTATSTRPGRPPAATSTDLSGAFQLTGLENGQYIIVASKRGSFLDTQYGQVHPDLPGKVVAVTDEGETTIEIAMMLPGVIAGRVFDETGDPLANATIVAIRQQTSPGDARAIGIMNIGGRVLRLAVGDERSTSNDRGEYRLFGLEPGRYLIAAMPAPNRGDARRPAAVYFPGVSDPAVAMRLEIGPGQEIANVDFTVRFVPALTITGIAVGPDDRPLSGGSVSLYLPGVEGLANLNQTATIQRDGTFRLEALTGQYILRARHPLRGEPGSSPYGSDLSLSVPITVGETDISGLYLELTLGAALKGRMVFEGSTAPPPSESRFRVMVESGAPGALVTARRTEDNTFVLNGVEAGERRLITAAPPGWIAKAVYVHGRDMADRPIEFQDGVVIENVSVVFTTVTSPLSITVQHAVPDASAAVVVFPRNPAMWHPRNPRIQIRTAAAAPLVLEMLPAGDYLVVAVADVAGKSLDPGNIRLLERLSPFAEPIQLVEGAVTSVRVRPIVLPQ